MELGKGKLLRTGLNALYRAIHPVHGIAWTDGKQVILTSLYQHNGEPKFGNSNVVGQFEHVHGLYWGPSCAPDVPALLAIQHKKHITMWQLCYSVSEKNKLMVYQISEIGELFPILPQGCVWHPKKEILAVLTTRDTSVLHSVRLNNSRIKADIKGTGLIHCACWTGEGNRLVVGIGSALHSYVWDDDQKTLNACSFCPIFDVGGYICAIEATLNSQVAVATELPLDKICSLNAGIAFEIPTEVVGNSVPSQTTSSGCEESIDVGKKLPDQENSVPVVTSASSPEDLTHIPSGKPKSDNNPLIHLRPKDYLTGSGHDASHLILVTFERKATATKKVSIPGILVPDIISFDLKTQTVVVASNTCNIILAYSLTSPHLPNIQQIQLDKSERPKGLCFLTDKLLLILVGKQKLTDPAFLPSSRSDKYILRLMIKEIVYEEGSTAFSGASQVCFTSVPVKREASEVHLSDPRPLSDGLVLPGSILIQSPRNGRKLIEEIQSPANDQSPLMSVADFKEKRTSRDFPRVLEMDAESTNHSLALQGLETSPGLSNIPASPNKQEYSSTETSNSSKANFLRSEKEVNYISKHLERLCNSFTELQHQLFELTELLKSGRKTLSGYPSAREPSFVNITYQKDSSGIVAPEKRSVVLCDDLSWIVLTADNEGYVPLTFDTMQEIVIRDANASCSYSGSTSSKTLDVVSSTDGYTKLSSQSLDLTTSSTEVLREHSSRSLGSNTSSDQASMS
ncbi:WD repeat and coiled-coil-containing protein-like isoform X2 [Hemicordylus capensis]|uniref:WD repeat and coiled-coil-containing protein-like isoform X2 n=1 Tax=Hemicordylus capensis TaxID=884348 RepID=UPI002303181A|nr:WD repeat and coiled-coil-containing protein-like isoform X2 [Hemicordylus capensis]